MYFTESLPNVLTRYFCYYNKKCFICGKRLKKEYTYHYRYYYCKCEFSIYYTTNNFYYNGGHIVANLSKDNFHYEISLSLDDDDKFYISYGSNVEYNYCLVKEFKKLDLKKEFLKHYNVLLFK